MAVSLLFVFLITILGSVFWIRMRVECATRETDDGNERILWIIVIVLAGWVGALIYYFVRRPRRMEEIGW